MAALPISAPTAPQQSNQEPPLQITKDLLLDQYGDKIKQLIAEDIDNDVEPERWVQVTQALRNCLYFQAKQYLRLSFRPDDSVGFVPMGLPIPGASETKEGPATFRYTFNITRADGAKFAAVLGQRAPHVEAVADDTESEDSSQRAREVNALFRYLKDKWQVDRRQKDVARHLWRTGPVFVYTPFVADGSKYGYHNLPQSVGLSKVSIGQPGEAVEVDVPSMLGTQRIPKGDVELHLASILEITWPQHAKSIEECEYLCYERDLHKAKLLSIYGQTKPGMTQQGLERVKKLREAIHSDQDAQSTSGKQAASDAREILLSQTVMRNQRKNSKRFSIYWLRPEWYELMPVPVGVRDALSEQWPDGLKVTMVGGELADIEQESMDDVWAVMKTGGDEKILADALCADLIPIQDIVNHFVNLIIETILRGIPKTIVDSSLLDRKSIEENPPTVAEVIFARKGAGGASFNDRIGQLPMATFHAQTIEVLKMFREMSREIDGILESIFGGGDPANTWREAEMKKNQALMQLGSTFDEMQAGWEKVYENGARQLAKCSSETLKVPEQQIEGGATIVDLASLDASGWHAEAQEGIPMSHAEEVDRLLYFINENNPGVAQRLDLMSDLNLERVWQLLGMRGFKSRRLMQIEKFYRFYLPQLKTGQPSQAPNPMTGAMEDAPSVQPDNFEDDQSFMAQVARDYLDSPGGLQLRQSQPLVYRNIKAFGLVAQRMAAPPPIPTPGGPAGPTIQSPGPGAGRVPPHPGGPLASAGAPGARKPPGQGAPGPMTPPGAPLPPVQPMVAPPG